MKRPKKGEVKKFGGVTDLGNVQAEGVIDRVAKDYNYEVQSIEAQSNIHLEDDEGHGGAAIVRMFEFGINPIAWKEMQPTKQDIFNSHYKGIEVALWKDGMKVMPDVNPKIVIDEKKLTYKIFVGAQPMKGHILNAKPRTLSELVHGNLNT